MYETSCQSRFNARYWMLCVILIFQLDPKSGREKGCYLLSSKHVQEESINHIRNESPVQVQCRIQDALGWCTGMTQRDGMGREEGGGFRMGNTCIPVADSF